jgi:two-component system, NarL family, response regulator DesR
MKHAMIRVVLADEEELIRNALVALLGQENDLRVVAQAANGRAAVDAALAHRPDVVVVNQDVPAMDGLAVTSELATALPSCAVVIMSGRVPPPNLQRALVAGAKGFLPKRSPGPALAEAIRRVHAGGRYVDHELAAEALTAPQCPLAPRELEALRLAERDTPVAVIARRMHLSQGTVRNYLAAVVTKLGVGSRAEAYRVAYENGWL